MHSDRFKASDSLSLSANRSHRPLELSASVLLYDGPPADKRNVVLTPRPASAAAPPPISSRNRSLPQTSRGLSPSSPRMAQIYQSVRPVATMESSVHPAGLPPQVTTARRPCTASFPICGSFQYLVSPHVACISLIAAGPWRASPV